MPFKLILFIIVVVLVTVFIGFNLENACSVWLFFRTFDNVPVFITIFAAFALGVLVMLPFTFGNSDGSRAKESRPVQPKQPKQPKPPKTPKTPKNSQPVYMKTGGAGTPSVSDSVPVSSAESADKDDNLSGSV